ncbi:hypothetical protein NliqN6_4213 [Naganishia liquefaciens]|uniref:Uncharacterized protein n=1 Tax=Naganishia liquefaciens TaxID=104408 RepID=A0A8H3TUJ2_9TREE|nr:hypothetical protein NliqN6_4213 [Naganishia liquefaciens]
MVIHPSLQEKSASMQGTGCRKSLATGHAILVTSSRGRRPATREFPSARDDRYHHLHRGSYIVPAIRSEVPCLEKRPSSTATVLPSLMGFVVGMVWYGMVWYGMVWYGMVWYGMVWYAYAASAKTDIKFTRHEQEVLEASLAVVEAQGIAAVDCDPPESFGIGARQWQSTGYGYEIASREQGPR